MREILSNSVTCSTVSHCISFIALPEFPRHRCRAEFPNSECAAAFIAERELFQFVTASDGGEGWNPLAGEWFFGILILAPGACKFVEHRCGDWCFNRVRQLCRNLFAAFSGSSDCFAD